MIATTEPSPDWAERVAWLRSIIDRAEHEIQHATRHGRTALVAEQKRMVAYRQLEQLMAQRPR